MKYILHLCLICVLRAISVIGDDKDTIFELMIYNFKGTARSDLWSCISGYGFIAPVAAQWGLLSFSRDFKTKLYKYISELHEKEKSPDEMDNDMANNICKEIKYVQDNCVENTKSCFAQFRQDLVKKRRVALTDQAYQKFAKSCKFINKNGKKFCLKSKTPAAED